MKIFEVYNCLKLLAGNTHNQVKSSPAPIEIVNINHAMVVPGYRLDPHYLAGFDNWEWFMICRPYHQGLR